MTATSTVTPARTTLVEDIDQIVEEIRESGWVSGSLTGYLGVRDTAALEAAARRQIAELGRVDALLAQVVAPLAAPVAQLVPDESAEPLRAGLQQMSEATGRAELRLSQVQLQVPQRWVGGVAGEAMQAHMEGLRTQMAAGSSAARAVDSAVVGATQVVTASRALVLANVVQGTAQALRWVQQYGQVLIQRGQLGEVVRQVGEMVHRVMQQIRAVVAELTSSQRSLAALVKRLGSALTVLGAAGGVVLLAGGGKKPKVPRGRTFINSPHVDGDGKSTNVVVPDNQQYNPARKDDGSFYKDPKTQESTRIMPRVDHNGRYPNGRTVVTDKAGRRLGPDGQGGDADHTHHAHGNQDGHSIPHVPNVNSSHPLILLPGQQELLRENACSHNPHARGCPGNYETRR